MEVYDLCREKLCIYRGFSNNRPQGNIGKLGSHEEVVLDHVMFFYLFFYFEKFLASLDQ